VLLVTPMLDGVLERRQTFWREQNTDIDSHPSIAELVQCHRPDDGIGNAPDSGDRRALVQRFLNFRFAHEEPFCCPYSEPEEFLTRPIETRRRHRRQLNTAAVLSQSAN
jgi:hypothetical protein